MISVLLPTRFRDELLGRSIHSLLARADSAVEILCAVDPDDEDSRRVCDAFGATSKIMPQRLGYDRLHEYYNALAAEAAGDWLLLWNDDAVMVSYGWDSVIGRQLPGVLWLSHNDQEGCNVFPAWPRAWTDAIGHVSLSPQCDSWMQEIGEIVGRQWKIDVTVVHETARLTGGPADQTFLDAQPTASRRTDEFNSPLMREARVRDAEVVRTLLA